MEHLLPIYSSEQIKSNDEFTILSEPISSIDLMERAASKFSEWVIMHYERNTIFKIYCGLGNNGGDGLAIARQLLQNNYKVEVYIAHYSNKYSTNFSINKQRLETFVPNCLKSITNIDDLPISQKSDIIIDAIFGIGLSKPLTGIVAEIVKHINLSNNTVISIDVPSGLFINKHTDKYLPFVKAKHTLTFQYPKLGFMFSENHNSVGNFHILDINLIQVSSIESHCSHFYITKKTIQSLIKSRSKFSHKGTYGHGLLIIGSYGKMGAAVLSSSAYLRSGAGLLTVCAPSCGYQIMQISVPEAMTIIKGDEYIHFEELNSNTYASIGIGPGIGINEHTQHSIKKILENYKKPLVIDADALNIIGLHKECLNLLPENSILTPHLKEFERLTRPALNDFDRHQIQHEFSKTYKVYVVLKGAHTCITTPDGKSYFNSSGNPGLAKGGSGDVLTGMLTALLTQGYSSLETCLIGVYTHGLAGDISKQEQGEIGMTTTDVIKNLPKAFKELSN